LGTYSFGGSAKEHVRLTDATGEDLSTWRQIGFDAIKWELGRWGDRIGSSRHQFNRS